MPVAVTAAPVVASATPVSTQDDTILQDARQWVFRVRNEDCLAVGSAFAASGQIITNRHVAAGASKLDLATWEGQDFTSQVAQHDDTEDLALLDGVPPEEAYATLAPSDPKPGTRVWVAGYPLGNQLTVTNGKVLGEVPGSRYGLGGPVLEINNHIEHGNSGSPLLDSSGEVVGVVFALDRVSKDGLAMPVSTLRSLMQSGRGDGAPIPCADLAP
ncbi:MAG TPA: serine protease [Acidimicrobiales bacterium]|nr:serine protease [Acidimicrobiales bacterium]